MTARNSSAAGPSPAGGGSAASLTDIELAVLEAVSTGATYRAMAKRFSMHVNTPSKILPRVVRKFGARNVTHAVYLACQCGLLPIRSAGDAAGMTQAGPSLRLLRSLVAEGFSVSVIAGRMGMGQPELSDVMARTTITLAMEARVRLAFAELAGRDPLALGVHPRGVTRARNRARAEGWEIVPPMSAPTVEPHAA